ncbi:hypothetical protein N7510_000051 [Penicillium lagena]|uniref:uncharacterized protein n=1 Tax=Penicillium lagena TaxID=94218 RepID=UPI00253F74CC|nr:uncharacterized protein N7510_000051 [Penicillium lagena]KAJ5623742.1 hypothetical protein N7510_000051 [Penicillium lagena]
MHSRSSSQHPKRSLSLTSSNSTSTRDSQPLYEKPKSNFLSSKRFHPRSKSPTPVNIPDTSSRQSMASQPRDIPRSAPKMSYFDDDHHSTSPVQMSPDNSSPRSPKEDFGTKCAPTSTRKTSDDYRRYSGTVNHCGRHSNDWLFGGFSVRDTVRDSFEKLRHHDEKES